MKFTQPEFTITKAYAEQLRKELSAFKTQTKTRKSLFLTMITTYGTTENIYYTGLVHDALTMDILFDKW